MLCQYDLDPPPRVGRLYRGMYSHTVYSAAAELLTLSGLVPPLLLEAPKRAVKL